MQNYISINFNDVVELVEDKKNNNVMYHKHEVLFMGYKLHIESFYDKETSDTKFIYSVYDKTNKLIKSRNAAPLKLSSFKGKFHLNDLRSGFLFFFTTIRDYLSQKSSLNKLHLNCFSELMNNDILFYDKTDIFLFNNVFVFAGSSNSSKNINDVFVGDKNSYQVMSFAREYFKHSNDLFNYLLSNKDYQFENEVLIELLYLKGE